MVAVPSHRVPVGDDRVGWIALSREGAGWRAELSPLPEDIDEAAAEFKRES